MTRYYRTVADAHSALCLDDGFDSLRGQRVTKRLLADRGYIVDPKEVALRAAEHRCAVCQEPVGQEYDGMGYGYPTHCADCRPWKHECDNGHVWYCTDAADRAADHRCPVCGEYWQ